MLYATHEIANKSDRMYNLYLHNLFYYKQQFFLTSFFLIFTDSLLICVILSTFKYNVAPQVEEQNAQKPIIILKLFCRVHETLLMIA